MEKFCLRFSILGVVLILTGCKGQQSISTPPDDTAVLLGANASIYCEVTGNAQGGDDLTWRKILSDGGTYFIGSNSNTNNATKHTVTEKYRLHILDTTLSDEGTYRCSVFPDDHEAFVAINVAPTSLTLKWPDDLDYTEPDQTSNLTCTASSSRPPATFRWFKGTAEVTSEAFNPNVTTDSDGYGEGISILEQTPKKSEEGIVYKCVADVPAMTDAVETTLTLSFSGVGQMAASLSVTGLAFLTAMMQL